MTKDKALAIFKYWYNWHGHWMYESEEKAMAQWQGNGIQGLPDYVW